MRRIFNVLYPFLIYMLAANIACVILLAVNVPILYGTAVGALISFVILMRFYKMDCILRGQGSDGAFGIPKGWIYPVLLGFALCFLGNNLIGLLRLDVFFPGYEEVAEDLYIGGVAGQLLCVGVLIPMAEEMVFRVLGFRRLRDDWGFWPSAIVSTFLFGLYHGNIQQFFYAILLGFIIAWAYEMTDMPAVPVVIHMAANIIAVIWTSIIPIRVQSITVSVWGAAAAFLVMVVCLKNIKRYGGLYRANPRR